MEDLQIDVQSFDIQRLVTVYPDRAGIRWWAKSWWNGSEDGEAAVEIETQKALGFINESIDKDTILEEYYPKQMETYRNAIEQTKDQLLKQLNLS